MKLVRAVAAVASSLGPNRPGEMRHALAAEDDDYLDERIRSIFAVTVADNIQTEASPVPPRGQHL